MPQVAFVSYSKGDSKYDTYLRDFVERLRVDLHQRCPAVVPTPAEALFFDSDNIETGEDWARVISASVRSCKVLVAFCSPHFVRNRFCGKEVHIFLRRLKEWQKQNGNTPARTVISVLWIDTEVPEALAKFQFDEAILPGEYRQYGLQTLCQLKKFDDQKKEVSIALAKRICQAIRQNLPPLETIPHFDVIPNVFDTPSAGTRYGIAVIDLLKGGTAPFALDNLLDRVCGTIVPYRTLEVDRNFARAVRAAKANREAVLIVADLSTLTNALFQNSMNEADAAGGEQTALVVAGSPQGVDAQDITVRGAFPKSYATFWVRRLDPAGLPGLQQSLSEVIAKLRNRLVREDPSTSAEDAAIVREAKAEGVPLGSKPMITGPEGPR